MTVLIVDSSSWIWYFRGRHVDLIDSAVTANRLRLPIVVVGELASGRLGHKERVELRRTLADLPLVGTDVEHWLRAGALRDELARKGVSVTMPDAHVAQATLDADGELLTEDLIFKSIAKHTKLRLASL